MTNKFYIGLDVSTTFTGLTVLRDDMHIELCTAIGFKKCNDVFEKADVIKKALEDLGIQPEKFAIEEPLMGFQKGMSSASTITGLFRFNGIVSYIARNVFSKPPVYISATHARKVCGMKMQKTKICGKSQKEQVFEWMQLHDLKSMPWPLKKDGTPKDECRDATDSYVIAKALILENP